MSSDTADFLSDLWRYKPTVVIVAVAGFVIFVLLVIDTHRYRKKKKGRQPKKH